MKGWLTVLSLILPFCLWSKHHDVHVHKGEASFHHHNEKTLHIENSEGAILHWKDFSIDVGEKVKFIQPSDKSFVLNRVTGSEMSSLLGVLKSNGSVFLINPNGVVIGSDAHIQTAGWTDHPRRSC